MSRGRREARRRARALRVDVARSPGPRRRRLDRRVHRLPAPGRAPRTSTRSTSGAASSRGRCATTRASPCSSAPTCATSSPTTSAAPVDVAVADLSFISLRHRRARARPLHRARRRPRAAGEAAVRSRAAPASARAASCAIPAVHRAVLHEVRDGLRDAGAARGRRDGVAAARRRRQRRVPGALRRARPRARRRPPRRRRGARQERRDASARSAWCRTPTARPRPQLARAGHRARSARARHRRAHAPRRDDVAHRRSTPPASTS